MTQNVVSLGMSCFFAQSLQKSSNISAMIDIAAKSANYYIFLEISV